MLIKFHIQQQIRNLNQESFKKIFLIHNIIII